MEQEDDDILISKVRSRNSSSKLQNDKLGSYHFLAHGGGGVW